VEKLVERERELAAIDALLERGGGVLVVEGGVGVGKTSLVDAACRRAQDAGRDTLSARGSEFEADFAFGVVRQLFERRLASLDGEDLEALLAGPAAAGALGPSSRAARVGHVVRRPAWPLLARRQSCGARAGPARGG
jgi:hypothetical protein